MTRRHWPAYIPGMILENVIALLLLCVGCVLVILDQRDDVKRWPFGGPVWRAYLGHTLLWGFFVWGAFSVV
jgi:hypothetical protein